MTKDMPKGQIEIIRTVQGMLSSLDDMSAVTPALISEKIELVLKIAPEWKEGLDKDSVVEELIRRCSLWIGKDALLSDERGHVPWLTADRRRDRKYWRRFEDWLEREMPRVVVDGIDHSTELILEQLEDPQRQGTWDRRGLVVGHVQSGKTANYTGLINKAADAGYKIIVVLAGVHNNLRSQTQVRLDEGFLGFDTHPERARPAVGAGEIDRDPALAPDYATNRSESGDFNPSNTKNFGITPDRRPCLFVVKKNKTPLERLLRWLESHVADTKDPESGEKRVAALPLLMIDDEADHASVDTGEQAFGPDGTPDEEHNPKTINRLIRRILRVFSRSAYVGYTATPFANIFIHEKAATRKEGTDLFPSAFILNLAASSDYVGPSRVFGLRTPEGRSECLPVVRPIRDHATPDGKGGWMPITHKGAHVPLFEGEDRIPASLVEAIDAFVLACAARRARGQARKHASMLVHVTRFNLVQAHVERQVSTHVQAMRLRLARRIDHEGILERLQGLWERDFVSTTLATGARWPMLSTRSPEPWTAIEAELASALDEIKVRTINGTARDVLDYQEAENLGLKVIAIGGDKLSRGLTLEGLCVSYFLRASRMYDTLMQMGRWFGYRPGYVDLCRLYTTPDLVEWFGHIADASEELREEFDIMVNSKESPLTYGHKVASHSVMLVTSRIKMRSARDLWLSFSGDVLETVVFHKDQAILRRNMDALEQLAAAMGTPVSTGAITRARPNRPAAWEGHLWEGVEAEAVCGFLSSYATHSDSYKVNSRLIAEFIRSMNGCGELTSWTVALVGGGEGASRSVAGLSAIRMLKRRDDDKAHAYTIGRLLSPRDEAIDLDEHEWASALEETIRAFREDPARKSGNGPEKDPPTEPGGVSVRKIRGRNHPQRGLLLLYLLDPALAREGLFPPGTPPVVGFGISFPSSKNGRKVRYTVNSVMLRQWEMEYDLAE